MYFDILSKKLFVFNETQKLAKLIENVSVLYQLTPPGQRDSHWLKSLRADSHWSTQRGNIITTSQVIFNC